jgi:DNA mismatch repair ATPase MutS
MRQYNELYQDMNKLLQQTAKPIANQLRKYIKVSSRTLVLLEPEVAFFIAAVRMIETAKAQGIPFNPPQAAPAADRITNIDDLYNIQLVLRGEKTMASTVQFDDSGRVGILTGPNSGGKTTYLRSVGGAQILFQTGLYIPAKSAQMSAVSRILTHFPRLETREQGRLAEEAERLRSLFADMDDNSLVLLNETFSSTAFGEALYLAQDILSALCAKGVRAVFATHLVELVEKFAEIEMAVTPRSKLCSLVAGIAVDENGNPTPTYRVTRGDPLGRSYAQEIARKYGISLQQILSAVNSS